MKANNNTIIKYKIRSNQKRMLFKFITKKKRVWYVIIKRNTKDSIKRWIDTQERPPL